MSLLTNSSTYGATWTNFAVDTNTSLFTGTGDYGSCVVVSGWWNITNFSPATAIWSYGVTGGTKLEVASAGTLDLTVNKGTTDAVLRTSSNTLPTGEWVFIATAIWTGTQFTSPVDFRAKIWVWTQANGFQEWALTVILSGSGTTTADGSWSINTQQLIAQPVNAYASQIYIHSTTTDIVVSGVSNPIDQYIVDETYNTCILPMFNGTFDPWSVHGRRVDGFASFGVPRSIGENWATTIYMPFDTRTIVANNTVYPAYVYTTMQTQPQLRVALSSASSNNVDNYSELEPPGQRIRRSAIDAPLPNQLMMRI